MFVKDDHFGSMYHLFTFPAVYLGTLFFLSVFTLLDLALERTYKLIKYRKIAQQEAAEQAHIEMERLSKTQVHDKLTDYHRKLI